MGSQLWATRSWVFWPKTGSSPTVYSSHCHQNRHHHHNHHQPPNLRNFNKKNSIIKFVVKVFVNLLLIIIISLLLLDCFVNRLQAGPTNRDYQLPPQPSMQCRPYMPPLPSSSNGYQRYQGYQGQHSRLHQPIYISTIGTWNSRLFLDLSTNIFNVSSMFFSESSIGCCKDLARWFLLMVNPDD